MNKGKINDRLVVGGQPTEEDLRALKAEGVTGVLNLRGAHEIDPAIEAKAAAALGLKYFHIPVNSADPKPEQVDAIRAALGEIGGPAFVHCQGGGRACAMALLATAPAAGYGSKELMAQAANAGFAITNPAMAAFAASRLDK